MTDIMIPISLLIAFTIIICTNLFFSSRNKKDVQKTIRQMIDQGQQLTPEVLERLGTYKTTKQIDLKRSLVLISLALACVIAGFIVDLPKVAFAIAIFPFMIGIALGISWRLAERDAQ